MSSMRNRGQKPVTVTKSFSPIKRVERGIPDLTRVFLFVRASGRCEFDGCPRYLMGHPVTLTEGNFAQVANVVAFRPEGTRGRTRLRPK